MVQGGSERINRMDDWARSGPRHLIVTVSVVKYMMAAIKNKN